MTNKKILVYPSNFKLHAYYASFFGQPIRGYNFIIPQSENSFLDFLKKIRLLKIIYRFIIARLGFYPLFNIVKGGQNKEQDFDFVFSMGVIYPGKEDYLLEILDNPYSLAGYDFDLFIKNVGYFQSKLEQKNCKGIICKNKFSLDFMRARFSDKVFSKCFLIYPSVHFQRKDNLDKFDKFTFLFVGSLTNPDDFIIKGGIEAVRAFKQIRDNNLQLIVRCKVPDHLKNEILEDKRIQLLEEKIEFVELQNIYKRSHVFLLPGHTFFLMATLEAMRYSLPIICLDSYGFDDLVRQNYNGFRIEKSKINPLYYNNEYPTNVRKAEFITHIIKGDKRVIDDLVKKMKLLIKNPDLLNKMGKNSKKILSRKFRMEINNKEMKKIFDASLPQR